MLCKIKRPSDGYKHKQNVSESLSQFIAPLALSRETHNQVLVIAAFKLPQYVGALPTFFGGVNNTVVTRLTRPVLGSKLSDVRLEPALLRCVRALSVVWRLVAEGGFASSVTCLLGCWRRRGPVESELVVPSGEPLDVIGVEDEWGP